MANFARIGEVGQKLQEAEEKGRKAEEEVERLRIELASARTKISQLEDDLADQTAETVYFKREILSAKDMCQALSRPEKHLTGVIKEKKPSFSLKPMINVITRQCYEAESEQARQAKTISKLNRRILKLKAKLGTKRPAANE